MKKVILIAILLLAVTGASVAYLMYQRGPVNVQEATAVPVGADALYRAFSLDSAFANKTYAGKVVLLKGQLVEQQLNMQKQPILLLKTNTDGAHINCTFEGPAGQLTPGATVTVKGIATGIGEADADLGIPADVYLIRCYLITQ
jgi:hypothetical protein